MKLAIVGSRTLTNVNLADFISELPSAIVSGGAKGIDTLAERFALENNIPTIIFLPDYEKYGRCAPIKRNEQIVAASDMVLAIWDGMSKGTLNSIHLAKKLGKRIKVILI